jgi:hypothetical protein
MRNSKKIEIIIEKIKMMEKENAEFKKLYEKNIDQERKTFIELFKLLNVKLVKEKIVKESICGDRIEEIIKLEKIVKK